MLLPRRMFLCLIIIFRYGKDFENERLELEAIFLHKLCCVTQCTMVSQRQKHAYRSSESIEVFYGIDKSVNAIIDFVNSSKHRYDVCADSKGPLYVTKIEGLRRSYIKFVGRGGHIRFITEITKENISYCKEVMKLVELRHIEGIRGIVRINEMEYQSNLAVLESKLATILLRSTLKRVVELQQYAFDTLWKKAIPADHRIKEIEIEQESEGSEIKEPRNTIQLWTNRDQDQYAIRLIGKPELLAATTHNTQYTILVDESEYIPELQYDWRYTLMHWVGNVNGSDDPKKPGVSKDTQDRINSYVSR